MKELLVLWIESYGKALLIANKCALLGAEVLDCSVIGKWSQVLVNAENIENIESILLEIPKDVDVKKKLLKNVNPIVIDSYLSLSSEKVLDFLLVVEQDFLGDSLELAQRMSNENIKIIDLRLLRFLEPKTLLVFSGAAEQLNTARLVTQNYMAQTSGKTTVSFIEDVHSNIKNLFSFDS